MTHFLGEPGRDLDCEKVMMERPLGVEVTQPPHEAQTLFGGAGVNRVCASRGYD